MEKKMLSVYLIITQVNRYDTHVHSGAILKYVLNNSKYIKTEF